MSFELKDRTCCPPGSFIFFHQNRKQESTHFAGATEMCARHLGINKEAAEQEVLEKTYFNMAPGVRDYFITKLVGSLIDQNPTFRYVPREKLLPAPFLYNPGMIAADGHNWLVYRRQKTNSDSTICRYNFQTEENFPVDIPELFPNEQFEDPRAFYFRGQTHICFSSWRKNWAYKPSLRAVRLVGDWKFDSEIELPFGGNGEGAVQKNWQFFDYGKKLHFVYWYDPFQVVRECSTVFTGPSLRWGHGEIRGGTPPVLVGDSYFTFFHSRTDSGRARYHMGCLQFSAKEPFTPQAMTMQPLLSGTNKEPSLSWAPLTVFPCGALYRKGKWCVSLGVNDLNCGLVDFNHEELLALMAPIR